MSKLQSWLADRVDSVQYPREQRPTPQLKRRMNFTEFLLRFCIGSVSFAAVVLGGVTVVFFALVFAELISALFTH
jgi:hypothetical protein